MNKLPYHWYASMRLLLLYGGFFYNKRNLRGSAGGFIVTILTNGQRLKKKGENI